MNGVKQRRNQPSRSIHQMHPMVMPGEYLARIRATWRKTVYIQVTCHALTGQTFIQLAECAVTGSDSMTTRKLTDKL
jgi:hypothetical protein